MKNFRVIAIGLVALVAVGILAAGCASMRLVSLEEDVQGPAQIRQGQLINPREVIVWGHYKNGSRRAVNIVQSELTYDSMKTGPQTVHVRVGIFNSQVVSFQTNVMPLTSLTIASEPTTDYFKIGDTPDPAWPGLEIRGEWQEMGSDKIELADCEISGYRIDQPGRQTVTVSHMGLLATFYVHFHAMVSLQVANPPDKLIYIQGEALDLTGLKVTGAWEVFPTEDLDITIDDIAGYNPNNVGSQRLSVTKNERTDYFNVNVLGLTSIEVERRPNKIRYSIGDEFDISGILLIGHYTGATPDMSRTDRIPEEEITWDGYNPNRSGDQRITIYGRGQTTHIFVDVEE